MSDATTVTRKLKGLIEEVRHKSGPDSERQMIQSLIVAGKYPDDTLEECREWLQKINNPPKRVVEEPEKKQKLAFIVFSN